MKKLGVVFAALAVCAGASSFSAEAGIQILTGSNVANTTEELKFTNNPPNGLTVQGITDPGTALVNFTGLETLVGNGGQASLTGLDGAFSQVSWILNTPNTGYTDLEFRIDFPNATGGPPDFGTITITILNQSGATFVLTNPLASNGLNAFQAQATGGDLITQVTLSGTQWTGIQQVRLGGIEQISAVPELSTWAMMLIGFAGVGFIAYRRAKKVPVAA
jgi:hypothetical protein